MLPANTYDRLFSREEALRLLDSLRDALKEIAIE